MPAETRDLVAAVGGLALFTNGRLVLVQTWWLLDELKLREHQLRVLNEAREEVRQLAGSISAPLARAPRPAGSREPIRSGPPPR